MKKFYISLALCATALTATQAQEKKATIYGDNIIRFSPLKVYDMGVGFGLSYERHLDQEQKVSFVLPVDVVLVNSYYDYNSMYGSQNKVNSYFYVSPGIKFYPSGQRKVNYALGANIFFGVGKNYYTESYMDQWNNWVYRDYELNHYRVGMMVNNYLNMNLTNKFNIGLELGLGALYVDKYENRPNEGINATGNVGFSLGFRF